MSAWDGAHDSDDDVAAVHDEGAAVAGAHLDDVAASIPKKVGRPRGSFNMAVILKRRRLEDQDEDSEASEARAWPAPGPDDCAAELGQIMLPRRSSVGGEVAQHGPHDQPQWS